MVLIASILIIAFLSLAGLHVYWARGGHWPGTDSQSLLTYVVGTSPSGAMPSPVACLAVTVALSVAACIPLALMGWVALPVVHPAVDLSHVARLAAYGCAGVLLLRGLFGYVDHRFRPAILGTPFYRLNRVLYSPLCLLLGSLMLYLAVQT